MLDINLIREKPKEVEQALQKRDPTVKLDKLLELDAKKRELLQEVEELRALRNKESDNIAKLKAEGKDAQEKIEAMRKVGEQIKNLDIEIGPLEEDIDEILSALPNIPHESVPVSEDKEDRPTIREWGEKRNFDFEPKNHVELG
jgi:seryl-tRNA synthetase